MVNLFAVPFDTFKSKLTNNGTIFNIIDNKGILYAQSEVLNIKYKRHDLCIKEQPEAPNEAREALQKHLNSLLGENQWKINTVFNKREAREVKELQEVKDIYDNAKAVIYRDQEVILTSISLNVHQGLR